MVVINGKNILKVFALIMLLILTFVITNYNVKNTNKKEIDSMQTVALPTNNKTIIIDARAWFTR